MAISWVPVTISVTVEVYGKNGLKRGPGILSAAFRRAPPRPVPDDTSTINSTGGGPFGTPVYQVSIRFMRHVHDPDPQFNLEIWAGRYYAEEYWVRHGQVFEARLQRY